MDKTDERNIDPIKELARIAGDQLKVASWRFKESFRSLKPGIIIYDSEWCRLSILWEGWDPLGGNSIQIRYGRLHAPNDEGTMNWNGEECYCWHDFDYALHFLDGLTPNDAARLNYSHQITDAFYEPEFRKKYSRRQPEWLALMHTTIWQFYGQRFFELFDLRQPIIWDRYRSFLTKVYNIEGRAPEFEPPLDKVC
jgi:hypothetical protein